jgi:hypothetical protein
MRAGDPIGPHRLDNLLGRLREQGRIEVRGYLGPMDKEPTTIPPIEWFGWVIVEGDRLTHVHSGKTLYGVEWRFTDCGRGGAAAGHEHVQAPPPSLADKSPAELEAILANEQQRRRQAGEPRLRANKARQWLRDRECSSAIADAVQKAVWRAERNAKRKTGGQQRQQLRQVADLVSPRHRKNAPP